VSETVLGTIEVVIASAILAGVIWGLTKARWALSRRLRAAAERRLGQHAVGAAFIQSPRLVRFVEAIVTVGVWALGLFLTYTWLTFGLRRFEYTRRWGDPLRSFFVGHVKEAALAMFAALPGLFTVLLILILTRIAARACQIFFNAVEEGRIVMPAKFAETAQPTRKLLTAALWLFAVAIAYPYLPGSESEGFKGVSVFVGLVVSLGSSGLVNQMMSGLTLTYSRAVRRGDYVAVGGFEGTVTDLGTLSLKIRTAQAEDVTIPNAVVVSQVVTNYSRMAETEGVFVPTSVTIGYDTPWRQVEAMLLLAASRTPGVRREPAPYVRKSSLEDPYIKYTLLFCLERPADRLDLLGDVNANIVDAFNEYGVQIMSPRYFADPATPKVVPKEHWYPAPATPKPPRP
jgi:small-conductance mechanosensitive channel